MQRIWLIFLWMLIGACSSRDKTLVTSFPSPLHNPATKAGIELGKALFFSKKLSGNGQTACASCHKPDSGFASAGFATVNSVERNIPSLYNLAWSPRHFWDGRAQSLESVMFLPIVNTKEMNGNLYEIVRHLNSQSDWREQFYRAFGEDSVYTALIGKAMAQYVRSLTKEIPKSSNSTIAKGLFIFNNHCSSCHSGPRTSDFALRPMVVHPKTLNPIDEQLKILKLKGATVEKERFKTPSLAGIGLTAPYMHDGSFKSLEEVVEAYARTLNKEELNNSENQAALIAFLKSL